MIVIFIIFILFAFIIFYNIIIWIRKRELRRANADEIGENGAIREGLKDPFKEINNAFKKIPEGIKKAEKEAKKGFNKLGGEFNKIGKEIGDKTTGAFNEVKKGTEGAFKQVENTFKQLGDEIKNTMVNEIAKPFAVITNIFDMITCYFNGIGDIFVAIGRYIGCFFEKLVNLPTCFLYYFLDIIYYSTIGLIIWFLGLIFPPFKQFVKIVYDAMMKIDKMSFDSTGFHIFKYQESVLNRCYRCKGLTGIPNLKEKCSKKGDPRIDPRTTTCTDKKDPDEDEDAEYKSKFSSLTSGNDDNSNDNSGSSSSTTRTNSDNTTTKRTSYFSSGTNSDQNNASDEINRDEIRSRFSTKTISEQEVEGRDI